MKPVLIDFGFTSHGIVADGWEVPVHDQEGLTSYFLYGYEPGGFLTSMLANDVHRACGNADQVNKQAMWAIAYWITTFAPHGSFGSYDAVQAWCRDHNGIRTAWADKVQKKFMWDTLKYQEVS